jgi:hypothetical protein
LLCGCFGTDVDPAGHPCMSDADCALGENLVCDPSAGVCVAPSDSSGEGDSTTIGDTSTSTSTSTSATSSTTGDASSGVDDGSSGSATTSPTTDGESGTTGEPGMLALDGVVPSKGRGDIDRDVVLLGAGFDDVTEVRFGDDVAEILGAAPDQLQVRVAANATVFGPVDVEVERDGEVVALPGGYTRVRGTPVFDALPTIEIADDGVVPATFEMVVGDFVGDAAIDLVMVWENGAGRVLVTEGDGAGGFTGGWEHPDPAISVDSGDFDGDGALDFVTTGGPGLRVYENDGFGGFTFTTTPGQIGFARGISTLDADHVDGPDVMVRGAYSTGIQVWHNDGNGGLIAPTTYSANEITSGDVPLRASTGDVTGDGWDDIVSPVETPMSVNGFATFVNDGAGGFGDPIFTDLGLGGRASVATHVNAGVDELLDIVALSFDVGAHALASNGDGTFDATDITPGVNGTARVATADFNCDDDSDIAIMDGGTSFQVHRGSPGGSFAQASGAMFANDGFNRALVAVDVDGDQLPDLVIAHHTPGGALQLHVHRNTSAD